MPGTMCDIPQYTRLRDRGAGFEGNLRPTTITDGMGVITDDIAPDVENAFAGKLSACAALTHSTILMYYSKLL